MVEINLSIAKPVIVQLMDRCSDFEVKVVENLEAIGFGEIEEAQTPS